MKSLKLKRDSFFQSRLMKNTYVLVGVIVTVGVVGGYGWNVITNSADTVVEVQENTRDFVTIPFGLEGELATISMIINGYEFTNTLSDVFGDTHAQENTKFVLVDATFTNTTNKPFTLYPGGMLLTDINGRKYDIFEATSGGAIGIEKSAIDGRELGSDINERGMLVYEVPSDFVPYSVEVEKVDSGSSFETFEFLVMN